MVFFLSLISKEENKKKSKDPMIKSRRNTWCTIDTYIYI